VRAGASYYSDEYAVLDRDGRVHPYPRALQMREPGDHRQTAVAVHELGGAAGTDPLDVALVLFCRYKPGGVWRPRNVSSGRAALEMFRYTMCAQFAPEAALRTFARVLSNAPALKGTRGDTAQVLDFIAERFGG